MEEGMNNEGETLKGLFILPPFAFIPESHQ
jgi:hypothetical protein